MLVKGITLFRRNWGRDTTPVGVRAGLAISVIFAKRLDPSLERLPQQSALLVSNTTNASNDNTKCLALQSHRPPQTSGENLMVPLEVVMRDFAHIVGALSNERSIWRGMCGRVSLSNHHQTTPCIHSPST